MKRFLSDIKIKEKRRTTKKKNLKVSFDFKSKENISSYENPI